MNLVSAAMLRRPHAPLSWALIAFVLSSSFDACAQFGAQQVVLTGWLSVKHVEAADLDGDLDHDLVVSNGNGCYRLLNVDGAGTFGAVDTITAVPLGVGQDSFGLLDMDGDSDVDLVLHDTEARELLLYRNDGSGLFADPELIAATPTYGFLQDLQCADIAGSELPDVILLYGGTVRWFVNEAGTFAITDSLQHTAEFECRNLLMGDVDMDGDVDHVLSGPDGSVYVGQNQDTSWASLELPYAFGGWYMYGHSLIDVDADGDQDFVDGMNSVRWYENTVSDSSTWGDYIEHDIAPSANEGAGWSEHLGCGSGASVFWCRWPYTTSLRWSRYDATLGGMTPPVELSGVPPVGDGRLHFGDLDGDGRKDLITFHHDTLSWCANELGTVANTPALEILCVGGQDYPLPDGLPAGGTWSGPFVQGNVFMTTLVPAGAYALTYTAADSIGCPATATVDLTVDICTGLRPRSDEPFLLMAPNPAEGSVNLSFPTATSAELEVLDALGRTVVRRARVSSPFQLNLAGMPTGPYSVRLIYPDGGKSTGTLVVR